MSFRRVDVWKESTEDLTRRFDLARVTIVCVVDLNLWKVTYIITSM